MNEAMTHILSHNVLKYNQLITCDQEMTLNSSIATSIDSFKPSFLFSKMRLDCFHFFTKVWLENVKMSSHKNEKSQQSIIIMRSWILSWFNYIETNENQ